MKIDPNPYNYYNHAPEHNHEMNVKGFRNFVIGVCIVAVIIVGIVIIMYV